ncbi:MAG TPA: hypothetical protein VIN73_02345 [Vicingaceae bacterium]
MERKAIKKSIKHKIIAGIEKEELVLLVFDKDEVDQQVKWKHSKEFQYKGEMFDIVEKEIIGNEIYYWVWWDKEETVLNQKLANLVRQSFAQNPYQNNKNQIITQFFKTLYFSAKTSVLFEDAKNNVVHFTPYLENFSLWQQLPITPPPQHS